jgi:hypothetical protein
MRWPQLYREDCWALGDSSVKRNKLAPMQVRGLFSLAAGILWDSRHQNVKHDEKRSQDQFDPQGRKNNSIGVSRIFPGTRQYSNTHAFYQNRIFRWQNANNAMGYNAVFSIERQQRSWNSCVTWILIVLCIYVHICKVMEENVASIFRAERDPK